MENEKKKESNLRNCKQCGELKLRALDGRYPNIKDSKYIDDTGRLWSGSVCPSCHRENCKIKAKERRAKAKEAPKC